MDDDELRTALRTWAGPVPPAPGARARVVERVTRRRRRRRALGIAAVVTVVAGTAGLTAALRGDEPGLVEPVRDPETGLVRGGDWRELPPSPLGPRYDALGAWTGEELVVVGGTTGFVCPPGADCAGPGPETWQRDGAAYDPGRQTWRPIADAPRSFAGGLATWSGAEVVVTSFGRRGGDTLAYDSAADSWRVLDAPPALFDRAVPTAEGIAFSSYDQGTRRDRPTDWLLDPATGAWTPLPHDPFGESYDRSLSWDGERLWLLSMSSEGHSGAHEGSPSRVAVLEGGLADGTWRVVDEATPDLTYEQDAWWVGGRLVVPTSSYGGDGTGRALDPATGTWTELPQSGRAEHDCPLPPAGVGPEWISGGGPELIATDLAGAVRVPPCPDLAKPDVAVWAGETLLLWGGVGRDWEESVSLGLSWTPPRP